MIHSFLAALVAAVACLAARPAQAADASIAFVVDRVYPSPAGEPLSNATVVMTGGKIVAVLRGKVLYRAKGF